ncbi:hypothetical protein E3N88_23294 [Mikania micrantha]|uniref:Reverse transcriptase domain-containing protein n=1 Tax=Mikania micrantha TaxID=192012 RepID=A0A5N6NEC9_9ASTR|nr:hypothetical protein E3N88_23294 [Mikania micrantha]
MEAKTDSLQTYPIWYFLDAYKGYHQIQMARQYEDKTAFYTADVTYYYTKMSFGLKNAGATYQHMMDNLFQHQIGRIVDVYVDDLVIKSREEETMIGNIKETFDTL